MADRRCRIKLRPDYANIQLLEDFIACCEFPDDDVYRRATLVAVECFDNIISHGKAFGRYSVEVVVDEAPEPRIRFRYPTTNFGEALRGNLHARPHYDAESGRYRGLGLRMCRNLSRRLVFRKGLFKSEITIIL
ncbi:MAG TPA: hypothetical protein PLU93_01420 [Treponemataceae bacterium]|nr:hypothetical protein [Treponemataceae bacterium]